MRIVLLLCLPIFVTIIAGCTSFSSAFGYSVSVANAGCKTIYVNEMVVTPQQTNRINSVPPNEYKKGEQASYGAFTGMPYEEVTVKWNLVETGKEYTQKVIIKLPKGFYNKEWGSRIIFVINSDKEQIRVAYDIFDEREEEYVIVDSEGKPFPIDDYAETE